MPEKLALIGIIALTLGIASASFLSLPLALAGFIFLLGLGCIGAWFFGRRDVYLIPALFLLCLALGAGRTTLAPRTLPSAFAPLLNAKVELIGTIVGDPDIRETNQRIPIEIEQSGVRTRILAVADRYPQFAYGDEVVVKGMLELPKPFDTDGGHTFAYDAFLAKEGIFALVPRASLTKTGESHLLLVRAQRLLYVGKHTFTRALEDALPEPHASLAEGLLTGGKQGLGKALLDAFTIAGLLPIVVLSGYNVMVIAEAVLVSLAFLPRRFALIIASLAILLFVLAAGAGTSALRAGLMAGLALFARATRRTYDALRALAVVFTLMLLANPFLLLYDPGFQFSFAATLGLILASSTLEVHLLRVPGKALREVFAATLAAQLFVLPLLLYQTGNLSLVAVPANLLVLPIVPFAMGFSALAGVIALAVSPLAVYAGLPAYVLLAYITSIAEFAARIPLAHVIIPAFPALLLVPAYAAVFWLVRALRRSRLRSGPLPTSN